MKNVEVLRKNLTSTIKKRSQQETTHEVGIYYPILPLLKTLLDKEVEESERKSQYFEKACENKVHYSKKDAETKRNYLHKTGRIVREYHCCLCNDWHLTHKDKYLEKGKTKKKTKLIRERRRIFKFKDYLFQLKTA